MILRAVNIWFVSLGALFCCNHAEFGGGGGGGDFGGWDFVWDEGGNFL